MYEAKIKFARRILRFITLILLLFIITSLWGDYSNTLEEMRNRLINTTTRITQLENKVIQLETHIKKIEYELEKQTKKEIIYKYKEPSDIGKDIGTKMLRHYGFFVLLVIAIEAVRRLLLK